MSTSHYPLIIRPVFVRPKDGAAMTGLSRSKFYELLSKGEFGPTVKVGACRLIRVEAIEQWADRQREEAPDQPEV
jgi:predicted DNA-binding transcriptional regulator AlpA